MEDEKEERDLYIQKEKYYEGTNYEKGKPPIDIGLLRKYILPHLEQLCRQFL